MSVLAGLRAGALDQLVYVLVCLGAGIAAQRAGVLTERWTDRLNHLAFYAALPALVFVSVYGQSLGALVSPALVGGLWVALFGTAFVAWYVHRDYASATRRGVATMQSYHTSVGVLGLPLVAALFGARVTAVASVVLGIVAFSQLPLTAFLLARVGNAERRLRDEVVRFFGNPVLAALLAGASASALGLPVPDPAIESLDAVSELALPAALLCVGASLPLDARPSDLETTGAVVGLKLGLMPILAWATFSRLSVASATLVAAVVMLAMPTAVSTFVYAGEFGGDDGFASTNVFATFVGSVGTLFVLLQFLR
ncbi:AEC family transporter [Haloplanus pelagicus]|uniref:AEC family transporter n=1 Tax=Haloplanus pelagicus TaxID=2949995 RepID=UPI00203D1D1E|nr:AEC family transporter [Haloplanus sp. HW8-1]